MAYRIEIWQYHDLTEAYESDSIEEILDWYKNNNWQYCYECGGCTFDIYKNDIELSFDEEYALGFYS